MAPDVTNIKSSAQRFRSYSAYVRKMSRATAMSIHLFGRGIPKRTADDYLNDYRVILVKQ